MNCACCGSSGSRSFAIYNDLKIVQCISCGLLYSDFQPNLKDLKSRYSDYELSAQWHHGSEFFNQHIVSMINKFTSHGARVLEIGCSYGFILSILEQNGYQVEGVEASSKACQYIKENYDFPIYEGFCENYLDEINERNIFDLILACNVLEHLRDPYATLSKLNKVLHQGGYILIVVPDIDLPKVICGIRRILRYSNPYYIDSPSGAWSIAFNCPEHLYYFSRKTLSLLCKRIGWQIIKQEHAPFVTSGQKPESLKDLIKPLHYKLVSFFERLGLGALGLSYSQLILARKQHQNKV